MMSLIFSVNLKHNLTALTYFVIYVAMNNVFSTCCMVSLVKEKIRPFRNGILSILSV